jgi:SAM-dependent methyltransferase
MELDQQYWEERYAQAETGWDVGHATPPITTFIDTLTDKNIAILVPGCGNGYEVEYLVQKGFTNVTVIDIAAAPIERLRQQLHEGAVQFNHGDFFDLPGSQYDLVLEQTFFCALDPMQRLPYVLQMHYILKPGGQLAGVLFDRTFEKAGPPFGGSAVEYDRLFRERFAQLSLEPCQNSIVPRMGFEVFITATKD